MRNIITVGREFGSGGREFARRLAETLGIEYYDKEIITAIAAHTSLSEEYVRQVVECTPHQLYPITVGQSISYASDYSIRQMQTVWNAQSEIIRDLAGKSDCVIVGRCADYILREQKPFRIFVYADLASRIRRCAARNTDPMMVGEKALFRYIRKIDRNRAKYYNFYTDQRWGDKQYYDLCVNTTDAVIKEIVPPVAKMLGAWMHD